MGRLISCLREAALRFSSDGCAFLAQAVAFNAIFALFPLVVLILGLASYVFPFAQERVLNFLGTFSPTLHQFVAANLGTYIYGNGISSAMVPPVAISRRPRLRSTARWVCRTCVPSSTTSRSR